MILIHLICFLLLFFSGVAYLHTKIEDDRLGLITAIAWAGSTFAIAVEILAYIFTHVRVSFV